MLCGPASRCQQELTERYYLGSTTLGLGCLRLEPFVRRKRGVRLGGTVMASVQQAQRVESFNRGRIEGNCHAIFVDCLVVAAVALECSAQVVVGRGKPGIVLQGFA